MREVVVKAVKDLLIRGHCMQSHYPRQLLLGRAADLDHHGVMLTYNLVEELEELATCATLIDQDE